MAYKKLKSHLKKLKPKESEYISEKKNVAKAAAVTTEPVKTKVKKRKDMSANLGPWLHDKLPDRTKKLGAGNVRLTTKKKLLKTRAQKGAHLNV